MRVILWLCILTILTACDRINEVFLEKDLLQRPPAKRCGECHSQIYRMWKESRHAKAWMSEQFREESENYSKLKCLSCHAPYEVKSLTKPLLRGRRRHEGINCVACHFKGRTKAMHGPYKVWSPPHPSKEDKSYTKSEICAGCHRETYREWKLSRTKISCQRCHMKVKDFTWIMDKFPFFLFHTRKALHDHTFPAGRAGYRELRAFLTERGLKLVNVGIPHNLPTADQGNPKLYVIVEIYYYDGKKRVLRRVLSPQSNTALRYLEPYYIKVPKYKRVKKVIVKVYRRLAWSEKKELILLDVLKPVKLETSSGINVLKYFSMATDIDINRIQKDMFIEYKGEPYRVLDYEHVKPGKGQAFVRVKAKNMLTGNVTEITFKASDRIPLADFEQVYATYSYNDGTNYYFMNTQTYDMLAVPKEQIEEETKFLKEGMEVIVFLYRGQPVGIELPKHVELKVVETEPAFKGDTQAGGTKPAKLETGAVIQVPFFVKEGDIVKVDTRTGSYVERVKE